MKYYIFRIGVRKPSIIFDLLDDTGSFMSREQLQIKYNFDNIDFLSYLRVKQNVQKFSQGI